MATAEKSGVLINRIVSFLVGGLLVYAVMSLSIVTNLKSQNEELTNQLDVVMFESGKLLSAAREQYADSDYVKAKASLTTLFDNQPGSAEAIEGRVLLAAIETTMAEADANWAAAMPDIQEKWATDFAADLRLKSDTARDEMEAGMVDLIIQEWEKAKTKIRTDWEMQG